MKLTYLLLLLLMPAGSWAQFHKSGVGKNGNVYTAYEVTVPMPDVEAPNMGRLIAYTLFKNNGTTPDAALQKYEAAFDKVLPLNEENLEKCGDHCQEMRVDWHSVKKNAYASFTVTVTKGNA